MHLKYEVRILADFFFLYPVQIKRSKKETAQRARSLQKSLFQADRKWISPVGSC